MPRSLKRKQWEDSDDPEPLISHLGRRGCTLDFTLLADVLLIRVWREVKDETFRQVLHCWLGTEETDLTQDEANDAAEDHLQELQDQLDDVDRDSAEYGVLSRQIELGQALLVFEGSGFEETMTDLCRSMASVAADPEKERKWQADTIRGLYDFDYVAPSE